MTFTRAHLPNPVAATMEEMDLHVGCICSPEQPEKQFVAVMLQPSDALLTEHKVGTVLRNWHDLAEVMNALLEQGVEAWGQPPWSAQ